MNMVESGKRWQAVQEGLRKMLTVQEIAKRLNLSRRSLNSWILNNGHLMMVMYGYLPYTSTMPASYTKFTEVYKRC